MATVYFFEIDDNSYIKSLENSSVFQNIRSLYGNANAKRTLPSFIGEAMVITAGGKFLKVSPLEISISRTASGKPYFEGFPQLKFNVSHTKSAVVAAFSKREIGIDIEKIRKPNFKVAERYFTEDEKEYLAKAKDKNTAFFEIWTAKEAYFKRKGSGLGKGLSTTSVLKEENAKIIKTFTLRDYVISVCSEDTQSPRLIEADEEFWG